MLQVSCLLPPNLIDTTRFTIHNPLNFKAQTVQMAAYTLFVSANPSPLYPFPPNSCPIFIPIPFFSQCNKTSYNKITGEVGATPLETKIPKVTICRNNTIKLYTIQCPIYSRMQLNKSRVNYLHFIKHYSQ